jgi:hypothetical protein
LLRGTSLSARARLAEQKGSAHGALTLPGSCLVRGTSISARARPAEQNARPTALWR